MKRYYLSVRFARWVRGNGQFAISGNKMVKNGDIVTVIGLSDDIRNTIQIVGVEHDGDVSHDRSQLNYRRILVSNPAVCWKTLRQVGLFRKFEGIVTRLRRGDRDFIPNTGTTIILGDHLRVMAPRENLPTIS
jgi:putative transport protein